LRSYVNRLQNEDNHLNLEKFLKIDKQRIGSLFLTNSPIIYSSF